MLCSLITRLKMSEENQNDSFGVPSNILIMIATLSMTGIILHLCAIVYMHLHFNVHKPIYKLMLTSCIISSAGTVLQIEFE